MAGRTSLQLFALLTVVLLAACREDPLRPGSEAQARIQAAVDFVYDTRVLHHIDIVIDPQYVPAVEQRTEYRVPATFTFDGVTLTNVGVRQSGGIAHPYRRIDDKPSLSIKFDEFVRGQELYGLEKMILKNERQDLSLINEHMTYEVFRRAGIAAPMTAHAVVTINGHLNGIYLMREPINKDFLRRNFGAEYADGNLYEVELGPGRNFIENPYEIDLKNQEEDGRRRDDIIAVANAVLSSTPQTFMSTVGALVDLDRYLTYYAVEAATSYYDGFSIHSNNTYLYFHPKDGRMLMIPWGADETFWAGTNPITRMQTPLLEPRSPAIFSQRFRQVPGFEEAFLAELARIGSPPTWDVDALLARVQQVADILATAERTGRTANDIARFEMYRPFIEDYIRAGGLTNGAENLPTPLEAPCNANTC